MIYFSDFSGGSAGGIYGSHTYWRVFCSDNWGGAGGIVIAEVEFLDGSDTVIPATGGTAIGSDDALGNEFSKAFDGSTSTSWFANSSATNQWVGYNFPSGVAVEKVRITLASSGTGFLTLMPKNCKLEYSDDGSSWTTAFTFFNVNLAGAVFTYPESTPVAGTHKFWRIFCADNNGGSLLVINEAELRATSGGADQVPTFSSNNGTSAARVLFSTQAVGNDGYRAFDGTSTAWATSTLTNQFVGALFAQPVAVEEISIQGASTANRSPKDITVDYSDDGTTWTTQKTLASQTGWASNETRVLAAI